MSELTCEDFRQISPELALGIADARERADAIAHLEHCPACRRDTRQLSDVADTLGALAPVVEPPAGFESRVVASLARSQTPAPIRRFAAHRAAVVAAAAALALLIGAGGWMVADRGSHAPRVAAAPIVTAELSADQHPVGEVIIDTGADPWMSMAVQADLGVATVRCQLRMSDGTTTTLGSFSLSDGYGYWATPLPPGSSFIDAAQLVGPRGRVLASAAFPSQRP